MRKPPPPFLFSCFPQANPVDPVAQVLFVDLRLFSRRTPQPCHFRVERPGFFLRTPSYQQNQRRAPGRAGRNLSSLLPRALNPYNLISLTCTAVKFCRFPLEILYWLPFLNLS